nr:MAG TPA: hypothetical protein [Caudoviricetes sp.]
MVYMPLLRKKVGDYNSKCCKPRGVYQVQRVQKRNRN